MTNNQDSSGNDSPGPGTPEIPDRIGPYKILSLIGAGGMGVVYLADQERPIRRRVALKLIKPGMASKAVMVRFEAERQAVARMSDPTIAKIFEAGTTEQGQPFFAMEYVKGIPLTDYCERQRLSLKDRLVIFMKVCRGVQHAHQKGVIHRDLKPSNILVDENEGRPLPKIIDFGLAKALDDEQLTEESLLTEEGALLGTPHYMSPEQADPNSLDVDTGTDIYSLGVILYQLLTSTLPIETSGLGSTAHFAALVATLKRIREEEPQKPSTRVGSRANISAEAGQNRRLDTMNLKRRLRGDLDWITMKALEKDRARRYLTANDLSADIERYLNHDPVLAGPPSRTYRLKKFVRKNAGLVASVLSLFVLLVAGVVISTFFYLQSEERRTEAENATKQEKVAKNIAIEKENEAVAAREREKEQREEAERQRDEVLRLSDIKRLQQLVAEADDLWPAHPDNIAAMEDWRKRSHELTENLEIHQASLAELRQQAIQGPDEQKDTSMEGSGPNEDEEAGTWKFAATQMQWRHDVLAELIAGLRVFLNPDPKIGTIASVGERLAFARTVRSETLEKYDVEWEEALASIANEGDCPAYKGLRLKSQLGLVPIGRDPDSGLWEFVDIQTGDVPSRGVDGRLVLQERTGLVLVLIPGGTFTMGSPEDEPDRKSNEGPQHEVTLDPFFLSKYEMTQGQWERFTGENPSNYEPDNYNTSWDRLPEGEKRLLLHPVEQVDWYACDRVLGQLGLTLPTEGQWEYAARAGTTTTWWTGAEPESLQGAANLADSHAKGHDAPSSWSFEPGFNDAFTVHAPVGSFRANAFGLHDTSGNVWEWCRDGFGSYDLPVNPGDGERLLESPARFHVFRGGSFSFPASSARSALRYVSAPEVRTFILGLRASRVITE